MLRSADGEEDVDDDDAEVDDDYVGTAGSNDFSSDDVDINWMLAMEEEIMRTLQVEEEAILAEFYEQAERNLESEAAAASDSVAQEQQYQAHLAHMCGDESQVVLCPVCQCNYLFSHQSVIFCNCGAMRVDSQGDCIGLSHLKEALRMAHESHTQRGCVLGKLVFCCGSMLGYSSSSSHLQAECTACGFFQVVI